MAKTQKVATSAEIKAAIQKYKEEAKNAKYYPPDGPTDPFFLPLFESYKREEGSWMDGKRKINFVEFLIKLNKTYLGKIKPETWEALKDALYVDVAKRLDEGDAKIKGTSIEENETIFSIRSDRGNAAKVEKCVKSWIQ